jgi:hypothetical protein
MSNKKTEKAATPKGPAPKKFNSKKSFSSLPDAIKDGIFLGCVGCELVVERVRNGKRHRSICVVKEINGNLIDTFDLTVQQCFTFQCDSLSLEKYNIVIKLNDGSSL